MTDNPFALIREKRPKLMVRFISKTFATGSTFRMLRGVRAQSVRRWLVEHMSDCAELSKIRERKAYDRTAMSVMRRLQESVGGAKKLPFGHAAKLVNLYVKEATSRRELLSDRQAQIIRRWAHVPIDSIILNGFRHDFPRHAESIGVKRNLPIKALTPKQHSQVQELLRKKAFEEKCNPLDYDLLWAIGPREKIREL